MKRMSLQWRLTCITTLCIAIICGCLTMFVYKNGVYYMDSLQEAVDAQGDDHIVEIRKKYISAYQRISGMSLQMIFLFRCTIIRQTTKKQSDHFSFIGSSWRSGYIFYKWACTQTDQ